jgi:uncharacterized protein YjiS (DUF1127 family)
MPKEAAMSLPVAFPASSMPFDAVRAVLRAAVAGLGRIRRAVRHRQELAILAGADDRALADIGLNRTDLRDALSQPVWRDPSELLTLRAGERRQAARRMPVPMARAQLRVVTEGFARISTNASSRLAR